MFPPVMITITKGLDFSHKNEFSFTFSAKIEESKAVFWNTQ